MWYERRAEDAEMIVQLDLWARLRRKSHVGGTSMSKKQFPASILVAHARHPSMLTSKGQFDSDFRRFCYGGRCSTVGHLNMDQANNRQQHSPRSRGIRCVSTSKVGSTPTFPPNFQRLRSSNAEQAVLTREVVSSSLTGGTNVFLGVAQSGRAPALGAGDCWFKSSHLDEMRGVPSAPPCWTRRTMKRDRPGCR